MRNSKRAQHDGRSTVIALDHATRPHGFHAHTRTRSHKRHGRHHTHTGRAAQLERRRHGKPVALQHAQLTVPYLTRQLNAQQACTISTTARGHHNRQDTLHDQRICKAPIAGRAGISLGSHQRACQSSATQGTATCMRIVQLSRKWCARCRQLKFRSPISKPRWHLTAATSSMIVDVRRSCLRTRRVEARGVAIGARRTGNSSHHRVRAPKRRLEPTSPPFACKPPLQAKTPARITPSRLAFGHPISAQIQLSN